MGERLDEDGGRGSVRIGYKLDYITAECRPPNVAKCLDLSVLSFLYFARLMWPRRREWLGFPPSADPWLNTTDEAVLEGRIRTEVAWVPLDPFTLRFFDYSPPFHTAETFAYHSRRPAARPWATRLGRGLRETFSSLSGPVWLVFLASSTAIHLTALLVRRLSAGPIRRLFPYPLLIAVNASTLVKLYRVNLSAATLVPLPHPPLFHSVQDLADLVHHQGYRILVYSNTSSLMEDIYGRPGESEEGEEGAVPLTSPALLPLKAALARRPARVMTTSYPEICAFLSAHPNYVFLDNSLDMDFACHPLCVTKSAALSDAFSKERVAFLFQKHSPELERAKVRLLGPSQLAWAEWWVVEALVGAVGPFLEVLQRRRGVISGRGCAGAEEEEAADRALSPEMTLGTLVVLAIGFAPAVLALTAEALWRRTPASQPSTLSALLQLHSALVHIHY